MNKLVTHKSGPNMFHPTFVSVETVTAEGAPYTFAVIYRNKHERSNMISATGRYGRLYAGGRSQHAVEAYAKTVDPNNEETYFIEAGGKLRRL
jgi:hypothetical protein